jgi:uncharacterized protein YaiI (UPF0178 family)
MKIWVDADACPVPIREILFRAAERAQCECILVANNPIPIPRGEWVKMLQVPRGFDVADNEIVSRVEINDLVITSDIPLAAEIIEKQAHALSPRGERFDASTIKSLLSVRDLMDTLRGSGIQSSTQAPFSHSDRQAFANQLDRFIQQNV